MVHIGSLSLMITQQSIASLLFDVSAPTSTIAILVLATTLLGSGFVSAQSVQEKLGPGYDEPKSSLMRYC